MSTTNALRQRTADELERKFTDNVGDNLTVEYAINREVNSAIQHYESKRFRWNEQIENEFGTAVSGTRNYSLPTNFLKMDSLKVKYSNAFITQHPRTWRELEQLQRQISGAQGIPDQYAIYGNTLRLYPIPNQTLTLVGSFLYRTGPPTSLSGSFTGAVVMGGTSLTVTTTTSHVSRMDGWTTDGEELIRSRAVAAFEINYTKNQLAITEMGLLARGNEPYLSIREMLAYQSLADEASDSGASGHIRPYNV